MASPYIITRASARRRRRRRGYTGALRAQKIQKYGYEIEVMPAVKRARVVPTPPTVMIYDSVTGEPVAQRVEAEPAVAVAEPGFQQTAAYGEAEIPIAHFQAQTAFAGASSSSTKRRNEAIGVAIAVLIGLTVATNLK